MPAAPPRAVDIAGSFRLVGGATGTILGTSAGTFALPLYHMIFTFERATIHFSDLDGPLDVFGPAMRYRESHALIGNYSRWDQYEASFRRSLARYLQSIRRAEPPPVPRHAGLEELQFEAALRRSVAQRRVVDLQQEFALET